MRSFLNRLVLRGQVAAWETLDLARQAGPLRHRSCHDSKPIDVATMEDRMLFSATPLAAAVAEAVTPVGEPIDAVSGIDDQVGTSQFAQFAFDSDSSQTNNEASLSDSGIQIPLAVADVTLDAHAESGLPHATESETESAQTTELILVDRSAENYQQLIDDIVNNTGENRNFQLFVFDHDRDGVEQITELLNDYRDIDALHIVSHGEDGNVRLGNSTVNIKNLAPYAGQIASWGSSFSSDADLLFYGCNLAATDYGQQLVHAFSVLTGADVAASADLTGHATLGGDWDLEFGVGKITTEIAFSAQLQADWFSLLNVTSFQEGTGGYGSAQDTNLDISSPDTDFGASTSITVNTASDGLIRFDDLIGDGPGQIPVGSTINSVSLTVEVTNASSPSANITLHRMLSAWDQSSTWNSMTGGIQTDDVEAASATDSTLGSPITLGSQTFTGAGLATTVQAWVDGNPNLGWALKNDKANDWGIASSDDPTVGIRPQLTIDYTPPPVLVVDQTLDQVDGNISSVSALLGDKGVDGLISLREAIRATNNTAGFEIISINPGTYTLSIEGAGEAFAVTGDLDIRDDVRIVGATAATTIVDGSGLVITPERVFDVQNGATVTFEQLTVTDGDGGGSGGGAVLVQSATDVTATNVVFDNNSGNNGGAIQNNGTFTASFTVFSNNTANSGGGIDNSGTLTLTNVEFSDNAVANAGGGLRNNGTATVNNATFSGNSANSGAGLHNGGGLANLSLTNVTISGNTAVSSGGGIATNQLIPATNVTIAYNTATDAAGTGGGVYLFGGAGDVDLKNSIIAYNTAAIGPNSNTALTTSGNNIVDDLTTLPTPGPGDHINTDPMLDPTLQNNGGFTLTHALTAGSTDAIDGGTNSGTPVLDQRGYARVGNTDIGAYEYNGFNPANDPPINSVPGAQATPQDTPLTFSTGNGNLISVSDEDAGGANLEVTLTVTNGDVTLDLPVNVATPVGAETIVNTTLGQTQAEAVVAIRDTGDYVVAWSGKGGGGETDGVWIQLFDSSGTPDVGGNIQVNTETTNVQSEPAIAMDDSGNFVVVWTSVAQDGDVRGIYGQRFDAAGNTVGAEFQINTTWVSNQRYPSVAMDADGDFVVVWEDKDTDGQNEGIFGQRYNSAGVPQGTEFQVNTVWIGKQIEPHVAMDAAGNFVVTWSDSGARDGHGHAVIAQRYDKDGIALGGEFQVNTNWDKDQIAGDIAMNAAGEFVIVWTSSQQDNGGTEGVYGQRFDASGTAVGGEFLINSTTVNDQENPSVSMAAGGGFVVTWESVNQDNPGELDGGFPVVRGVYSQQFDSAGNPLGGETLVNATVTGHQVAPDVAMNAAGDFVIAWDGNGPTDDQGVFHQRFEQPPPPITFSIGDGFNDSLVRFQGSIADINNTLDGMVFTPDPGFTGLATVDITTDDLGNSGTGGPETDMETVNITVTSTNTPPTITSDGSGPSAAMNVAENTTAVTTVTATDADLPAQTLTYSISGGADQGLFNIVGGTGVLTFAAAPDFESPGDAGANNVYDVQVQVSDGNGGVDTQDIAVTVTDIGSAEFWLNTFGDIPSPSGAPGLDSWTAGEVLEFGGPSLSLDPDGAPANTTSGQFVSVFNLDALVQDSDARLNAIHYVSTAITVGSGPNTWNLNAGDVLFSTQDAETLQSTNSLAVTGQDLVAFRPDTPGNYSSGTFTMLLDGSQIPEISIGLHGVSLVESDTTVGDSVLSAGTFLLADAANANIYHYTADGVGVGTTSGMWSTLIEGADINIGQFPRSIELLEAPLEIGETTLPSGTILLTLNNDDSVGDNNIPVLRQDVFSLSVSKTEWDQTTSVANATLMIDGSDIGIDAADERFHGLTLLPAATNVAPVITSNGGASTAAINVAENSTAVTTVAATDVDLPAQTLTYSISGGADQALFNIVGGTGVLTFASAPDFETPGDAGANNVYDVQVQVSDGVGGLDTQDIAITVTNVSEGHSGTVSIAGTPTEDQILTASNTLTDPDGMGTVSYQWQRNGSDITGETSTTYTLDDIDVGQNIRVVASYTDGGGFAESEVSTAVGPIAPVNDAPSGAVNITGTPTEDQVLTAANTLTDADGLGPISYQWQRNGTDITGETGTTYTLDDIDVGQMIRVVASYTDGQGFNESVASTAVGAIAAVNDAPSGTVSITGTPTEDQILTASNTLTDADGLGPISYQWQRNGTDITGETGTTYTLDDVDVGQMIRVVASYTDGQGFNESVNSAVVGPIGNVNDPPGGSVVISGTPTEDQILTVTNTLTDADGLGLISYQWQRNGIDITGETGTTYTLDDIDVGQNIRVVASYTDGQGFNESVGSTAVGPIVNVNDAPGGAVNISGGAVVGNLLTASNTLTDDDGLGAISYQWKRSGLDILGATGSTYTITALDLAQMITVEASYTDSQGTAESVLSAAVGPVVLVNNPPSGSVTISGTTTEDQVLTASNTLTDPDGLGPVTYQWQRGGVDITGETASTYTLDDIDVGQNIRVVASYTDGNSTNESVNSTPVGPIVAVNDTPGGSVNISGTPSEDQVLTASNTLTDVDGLGVISYQWQRGGVDITGETASTYTLDDIDVGQSIRVVASYTDGQGFNESVNSTAVGPIAAVNDTPTGSVNISGTPTEDQILTASNTLADVDGLGTISYQWHRNGSDITGETGTTYTLDDIDVGQSIRVVASYTDGQGFGESVNSTAVGPIANVNDAPGGSVSISGSLLEGSTLTATNTITDDDGLGPISYQWQRGGVDITGATAANYVLMPTDVGQLIRVVASYTDGNLTAETVNSLAVGPITNINNPPSGTVSISGIATEDQVLTASNTLADLDGLGPITYQWQRGGVDILGATGTSYALVDADVNQNIRVAARYTDGNGTNETVFSSPIGPIAAVNDPHTGTVSITGTPTEDQILTASNTLADVDGLGPITYQWQRNGTDIVGATAATYTLGDADVGQNIRVVASYTDGQGFNESETSAAVGPIASVNDAPGGSVVISGIPTEDQVLTASNTLTDADGLGPISYQWQRGGVDITGATTTTYTLGDADVGQLINVVAKYTDGGGTTESVSSAAVGPVASVDPVVTPLTPVPTVASPAFDDDPSPAEDSPEEESIDDSDDEETIEAPPQPPSRRRAESLVQQFDAPIIVSAAHDIDAAEQPLFALSSESGEPKSKTLSQDAASRSTEPDRVSIRDLTFETTTSSLWNDLDQLGNRMESDAEIPDFIIGSAAGVTTTLSVGYVAWMIRGGHILAGVIAQLPAWRLVDPLPVLSALSNEEDDDEDDSLESLVDSNTDDDEEETGYPPETVAESPVEAD